MLWLGKKGVKRDNLLNLRRSNISCVMNVNSVRMGLRLIKNSFNGIKIKYLNDLYNKYFKMIFNDFMGK